MPKFLFTYHGGGAPESPEAQAKVMQAWGEWMGSMGEDVVDGGNPAGPSKMVKPDGSVEDGGTVSGYGLFNAANYDDAVAKAKGCPVLESGGTVEVTEAVEIDM